MNPTKAQLEILWHTLGLKIDNRVSYRNYFVADDAHHSITVLRELEALKLMAVARSPSFLEKGSITFMVTDAGKELALEHLPSPPPSTKYDDWIAQDGTLSFGQFITSGRAPKFEQRGWSHRGDASYRMYREVWDDYDRRHYRDVQGEWMPTKKAAKATYKIALKAHRETLKAQTQ